MPKITSKKTSTDHATVFVNGVFAMNLMRIKRSRRELQGDVVWYEWHGQLNGVELKGQNITACKAKLALILAADDYMPSDDVLLAALGPCNK